MSSTRPPHAPVSPMLAIDPSLSPLDIRVAIVIAVHDRMSTVRGKGDGCTASRDRLLALIGCDNTSLSHSLRRLENGGYISSERSAGDGRKRTYRTLFPDWKKWEHACDMLLGAYWQPRLARKNVVHSEQSSPNPQGVSEAGIIGRPNQETRARPPRNGCKIVGGSDQLSAEIVGRETEIVGQKSEIVGHGAPKNGGKLPKPEHQYDEDDYVQTSENDPVETAEHHSAEAARLAARRGSYRNGSEVGAHLVSLEQALRSRPGSLNLQHELTQLLRTRDGKLSFGTPEFRLAEHLITDLRDLIADAAERQAGQIEDRAW